MKVVCYEKKKRNHEQLIRAMIEAIIDLDIPQYGKVMFGSAEFISNDTKTIENLLDYYCDALEVYIVTPDKAEAAKQDYIIMWI